MHRQASKGLASTVFVPWNKGRLIGQKPPLSLKEIRGIRIRLQIAERVRDLALFNLAVVSKLHGCDLVRLRVRDVAHGARISSPAPQSCSRRPASPSASRSRRRRGRLFRRGLQSGISHQLPSCFRAATSGHKKQYPMELIIPNNQVANVLITRLRTGELEWLVFRKNSLK
jgi:hypothetical protein